MDRADIRQVVTWRVAKADKTVERGMIFSAENVKNKKKSFLWEIGKHYILCFVGWLRKKRKSQNNKAT